MIPPWASFLTLLSMSPKKRARASGSSTSNAPCSQLEMIKLEGGHPLPPAFVSLWKEGSMCDACVKVGGADTFMAHRVVLASGSDYVAALIRNGSRFRNDAADTIELPETSPVAFKSVLTFLYEGQCTLVADDAAIALVLQTAMLLQVTPLVSAAAAALESRLCATNCFQIWATAET